MFARESVCEREKKNQKEVIDRVHEREEKERCERARECVRESDKKEKEKETERVCEREIV